MRVVGAVLCLVGACGFTPGVANNGSGDDGGMNQPDGPVQVDAAVVPIDGPNCYGKGLLQVCFDNALPGTFTAPPSGTLATDTDASCTKVFTQPSGRELCVVAAQTVDVAVDLRAIGNRPLVLIAATTLNIDAGVTIDVASRDGSNTGAGGNDSACGVPGTPDNDSGGGGGAAGGSFIGKGGNGGEGDSNSTTSADGVASPSTATSAVTTTIVRGGCRGGIGGGSAPNATTHRKAAVAATARSAASTTARPARPTSAAVEVAAAVPVSSTPRARSRAPARFLQARPS